MQAALPLNKPVPLYSFGLVSLLLAGIVLVPLPEILSDFRSGPSRGSEEIKHMAARVGEEGLGVPWPGPEQQAKAEIESAPPTTGTLEPTRQGSEQMRAELVQHALNWQGVAYAWGGDSRAGIDCSALVQKVFASVGISLPRTTYGQFREGVGVAQSRLLPGDLVFFSTGGPGASHVGIYLGATKFLSATRRQVEIQSLAMLYWKKAYRGSRRIIK